MNALAKLVLFAGLAVVSAGLVVGVCGFVALNAIAEKSK